MALNLGLVVAVAVGWVFVLLLITCLRRGKKDKDIEKQKQNHLVSNDVKSKEKHGHSNPGFDEISEITSNNKLKEKNNIAKSPKRQADDTPMQITNVKPTANGISNDIKHVTTVTVEINAEDNNNSMSNDPGLKDTTDDNAKTTNNGPVSGVVDDVEKNHIENGHVPSGNQEDLNEDDVKVDVQDAEPDGPDLSADPNSSPSKQKHDSSQKNGEETLPQVEPAADETSPADASSPPPFEPEENEQDSVPEEKDEEKPGTSASAQENTGDKEESDESGSTQGVPPIPPLSQLSQEEKRKYYEKRQDDDTGEVTCEITRAALLAAMQNGEIAPDKRVPLSYCDSGSDGEEQEANDGQINDQQGDNADAADNQSHDQQQNVSEDSAEIADGQSSDQQQDSSREPDESVETADDQQNDQQQNETEVKHDTADDQSSDQQHAIEEAAEGQRNDQGDDIVKDSKETADDQSNDQQDVEVDEKQDINVTVATLTQDGMLGNDEKADDDSSDKLPQEKETENSGDNMKPETEQVVDNVGSKSSVDNATGDKAEERGEGDKGEDLKESVAKKQEHSVESNLEQQGATENEKNDEVAKSETTDEKKSESQDSPMTVNKNGTSIPIPPKFEQNNLQKAAPSTDVAADRKTPVSPQKDTSKARNTVKESESKEPAKKPAGIAQTIAKLNQIQQEKLAVYQYSAKPKPKPPVQASKAPAPRPADIVRYTPPKKKDNAEYWPAQRASLGSNEGAARFDMEAELQQRLRSTDGVGLRSGFGINRHKGRVMRKSYGGTQN